MASLTNDRSFNRMPAWLLPLAGTLLMVAGAIGLWGAIRFSLNAEPASGTIVDFHADGPHSATIVGQVDVHISATRVFRTGITDTFHAADWSSGGSVRLRCSMKRGLPNCQVDAWVDLWLWPTVFCVAGALLLVIYVRKRLSR